jgi:hypothetical protein
MSEEIPPPASTTTVTTENKTVEVTENPVIVGAAVKKFEFANWSASLLLVGTIGLVYVGKEIYEPLYTLDIMAGTYLFGKALMDKADSLRK